MPSGQYLQAAVIAAVIGMADSPALAQTSPDEIAKVHLEAKAALDPELPKRVDGMTVLTAVRTQGATFTYEFKIERDKAELPPEFDRVLGKNALAIACGNERNRKIMLAGGRYGFEFRDKFDAELLSVTVTKDDCVV